MSKIKLLLDVVQDVRALSDSLQAVADFIQLGTASPEETPAQPDMAPEATPQCEAASEQPAPETEELLCAPEQALPPEPAQPAWQPETRLEQMAAELMGWFDAMMPQE